MKARCLTHESADGAAFIVEEVGDFDGQTGLDRDSLRELARKSPPPQSWFDGDEEKPF